MRQKITAALLALSLLFGLSACGDEDFKGGEVERELEDGPDGEDD